MKHKWKITREVIGYKVYDCKVCGAEACGKSVKDIEIYFPECDGEDRRGKNV